MRALCLVVALVAVACGDAPQVAVNVNLSPAGCGAVNPLASPDAAKVRVTVEADGAREVVEAAIAAKEARAIVLPVGTGRRVVVDVLDAAGAVVGRGRSAPLDVAGTDTTVDVDVVVQPVGAPFGLPTADGGCAKLTTPRAGHTATLLADGRIFIAGGYSGRGAARVYLKTTEILDPATGAVTAGPELGVERAFHTALLVGGGKVLLSGGETPVALSAPEPLGSSYVYDPAKGTATFVSQKEGRTRHVAFTLGNRHVLAGGYDRDGSALASTEYFDGSIFNKGPDLTVARGDASVVVQGTSAWLIGGSNDNNVHTSVDRMDGAGSLAVESAGSLGTARVRPHVAPWPNGGILVAGGGDLTSLEYFMTELGATKPLLPTLSGARSGAASIALEVGRLVIAGGTVDGTVADDLFVLGTEAGIRSFGASTSAVSHGTATALGQDAVVLTGGDTADGARDAVQVLLVP